MEPPSSPTHTYEPGDPPSSRRGTVIGSPGSGFYGGDPVADAAAWCAARGRWSTTDLARISMGAVGLSAKLSPIDRRVVSLLTFERVKLGAALLEFRAAAEDLSLISKQLGALLRSAMWADPAAQAAAQREGDVLLSALRAFQAVWERHTAFGERVHPWPGFRADGRIEGVVRT